MLLKITHLSSLTKSPWLRNHQALVKWIFCVLFCTGLAQVSAKRSDIHKQFQYRSNTHIAKIYISGSMCFACLKQLEHKLKLLGGVHAVSLDLSALKKHSVVRKRAALLIVSYDTNKLSLAHIEQFVTNNDFQITKIQDKKL